MSEIALSVTGLRAGYGHVLVLDGLDLSLPASGVTVLLGPTGAGKSSIFRALCGSDRDDGFWCTWTSATYGGRPLGEGKRPTLCRQLTPLEARHRTVGERVWAMKASLASDSPVVCIDEPTAGLDPKAAPELLELLRTEAAGRSLLCITHNMAHARALADRVLLFAGGRILESGPAEAFFAGPATEAGRVFLRTGGISAPSPGAPRHMLAPEFRPLPARIRKPDAVPRASEIAWAVEGALGAVPKPGTTRPLDEDLAALKRAGVTTLVSVSETGMLPIETLAEHGLVGLWFPMNDRALPTPSDGLSLCGECQRLLDAEEVVAVYAEPRDSLAATVIASQLVFMGASAKDAAALSATLLGVDSLPVGHEQYIWDVEFQLDVVRVRPESRAARNRAGAPSARKRGMASGMRSALG